MAPPSMNYDGGDEGWMQPADDLWDPGYIDVRDLFPNAFTMQASPGMNSGSLVPRSAASSVPRGGVALEQLQAMDINFFREPHINSEPQHLPSGTVEPNIEDQQSSDSTFQDEDTQEDEPEYVTYPKASHPPKRSSQESGPSLPAWDARKDEIKYWYIGQNYTCEKTMNEMAKKGFHATMSMYKRKFNSWGWKKYGAQPLIRRAGRRPRRTANSSPGTVQDTNLNSCTSPGSTVAALSPPIFNAGIPKAMSKTKILGLCDAMLFNAKELYLSYLSQEKWKVARECEVEEDIHDDLLIGVAVSLRNYDSLGQSGPTIGFQGILQAFEVLEKVVGVQKGADCGLFSLPAIWESFLRMIRKEKPELAASFLLQAIRLASQRFGKDHHFAQVLLILRKIQAEDPRQLADVIFTVYRSCIEYVGNFLGSFHLTTLSLWGDFVVYLDGSSINETQAAVDNIRQGIRRSEAENGLDHAYTLELLGLTLYVLQSDPMMAEEAEEVALDMFQRVERIKANAGGKLEGDLIITRKDLKHTLGTLKCDQKDYEKAIEYLEEFFQNEVMDSRDTLALQRLEECYTSLGQLEKAAMVQKRRTEACRILFCHDWVETPEDDKASSKEEGKAEIVDRELIEGTTADNIPNSNEKKDQDEESEEEDDDCTDEVVEIEVEKQLLREQISNWEQRLEALEKEGQNGERGKKGKKGRKKRKESL